MTRTISIKNYLKIFLFGGLFVFIIVYSIFQMRAIAKGVDLKITGIDDGASFDKEFVPLTGTATHAKHLNINGKEVNIDEKSNFYEELALSPGYNIITVEAKDRFDKKTKKTYQVFYKTTAENLVEEDGQSKIISANN